MDVSVFVAKLFGVTCIVVGLGFFISKSHYQKLLKEVPKNTTLIYLGGLIALLVGLVLVLEHNMWASNWKVLITIIGWIALIKGIILLIKPQMMMGMVSFWEKNFALTGLIVLILGLVLSYFGFSGAM